MRFKKNGISVIVPVYNSAKILSKLHDRLMNVLKEITDEYEVIFINDGSEDESFDVIKQLSDKNPLCRNISLMKNYGQHNALLCGIRNANYDVIITIDDDLQNPPEEIPKILGKLNQGYDVVYGTPTNEQHGLFRNLASVLTKVALQTVMGVEKARRVSAFRAFRSTIRDSFQEYRGSLVSIDVLLSWGTNNFTSVEVEHHGRELGESNYTFRKLIIHALNLITGFSVLPLQIASLLGFIFAAFGFMVFIYVVGIFMFFGAPVQGFPFLASIICIFSGTQLLSIGIIGEYLARMHFRSMDKPQYVEKKTDS